MKISAQNQASESSVANRLVVGYTWWPAWGRVKEISCMSDRSVALIAASSALLGAIAGAAVAAFGAIKVAEVQLQQAMINTQATSALSMRTTLAEKSALFFSANEDFLLLVSNTDATPDAITSSANKVSSAASQLYPYLDGDLLNAGRDISNSVSTLVRRGEVGLPARQKAADDYRAAYKSFQTLYLRLKRKLEKSALVDVVDVQIADQYKHDKP
jgi:hypothetical protein